MTEEKSPPYCLQIQQLLARGACILLPLALLIAAHTLVAENRTTATEFKAMTARMSRGKVTEVHIESLQELENALLIDTRSQVEYQVSHIPGARHVGFYSFDSTALHSVDRDTKIIAYCSVGFRSERVGEQLLDAGFKNVFNLEGGLFGWVNRELPIVDAQDRATRKVHGFSKDWGRWLEKGVVVYDSEKIGLQ